MPDLAGDVSRVNSWSIARYVTPGFAWLNYPQPATVLRAVKRRPPRSASLDASGLNRTRIHKRPSRGRGIIIVGSNNMIGKWKAHLDEQATKTTPKAAPTDSPEGISE